MLVVESCFRETRANQRGGGHGVRGVCVSAMGLLRLMAMYLPTTASVSYIRPNDLLYVMWSKKEQDGICVSGCRNPAVSGIAVREKIIIMVPLLQTDIARIVFVKSREVRNPEAEIQAADGMDFQIIFRVEKSNGEPISPFVLWKDSGESSCSGT